MRDRFRARVAARVRPSMSEDVTIGRNVGGVCERKCCCFPVEGESSGAAEVTGNF